MVNINILPIKDYDIIKLIDPNEKEIIAQVSAYSNNTLTLFIDDKNLEDVKLDLDVLICGKLVDDFMLLDEASLFKHHIAFTQKMYHDQKKINENFEKRIATLEFKSN